MCSSVARPGAPSRRDDDRYLFLEALLSARDCLYISHVARDERSNEEIARAVAMALISHASIGNCSTSLETRA